MPITANTYDVLEEDIRLKLKEEGKKFFRRNRKDLSSCFNRSYHYLLRLLSELESQGRIDLQFIDNKKEIIITLRDE